MTDNIPDTIEEFVEACVGKTNDEIYDLFEVQIGEDLRDEISEHADLESPEPCRSAMNALGLKYGVQALIDY